MLQDCREFAGNGLAELFKTRVEHKILSHIG